ncbi:uncharacterized protein [Bemisia tabaci]|nr:PREDICTED: uncharacterized protein LOC109034047 isoform X2 [Bemisia tabaci]
MHGARRVAVFCLLTAVLPTILLIIPLYLRHSVFMDVVYSVAESDVLEIVEGISTIFCQGQTLKMNSSFSAFQIKGSPEPQTDIRKHIRLKKSMSLPDDTLEYWGFYLPNGSTVSLSVCSRYDGSRILVVKGEKNLKTCGLLNHPMRKPPSMATGQGQVTVTFETNAQVILSDNDIDPPQNGTDERDFEGEDLSDYNMEEEKRKEIEEIRNKNIKILSNQEKKVADNKNLIESDSKSKADVSPKLHRRRRHEKTKSKHEIEKELLAKLLNEDESERVTSPKRKRFAKAAQQSHRFDGGLVHGGNALTYNTSAHDSSFSSFEYGLYTCYDGNILLTQGFPPSKLCTSVEFFEMQKHMKTVHDVVSDGYYYYIFYSDNDFQLNDIHAVFDIYKPTYMYGNYSHGCINKTECYFPINFLSDETVVVEVPTRDGIEHEGDDITLLTSTCHPRVTVYMLFPISILFLILSCAFL